MLKTKAPPAIEALLTTEQVAERLQVTPGTVLNLLRSKALPEPLRLSQRTFRWRESDIAEFIASIAKRKSARAMAHA